MSQDVSLALSKSSVYNAIQLFDVNLCKSDLLNTPKTVLALDCFSLTLKRALVISYYEIDVRFQVTGTRRSEKTILIALDWEILKTIAGDWLELWLSYMFYELSPGHAEVFPYGCHILILKCLYSKKLVEGHTIHSASLCSPLFGCCWTNLEFSWPWERFAIDWSDWRKLKKCNQRIN